MNPELSRAQDEDWSWIQAFREGDASAFERIFEKYQRLVINLAFRFVRERAVAEDIAQEVFIKLYEKKLRLEPKAKFTTWLYRVTVNLTLDVLRKRKNVLRSLDETIGDPKGAKTTWLDKVADPGAVSAKVLEGEEIQLIVQRAVHALPEKLKWPILLYQFEELPYKEIATILGISAKAVERRIYHAKEALRPLLSKYL